MKACFQFEGQNLLEHGQSVHRWFADLYGHLTSGSALELGWSLPTWFNSENYDLFRSALPDLESLKRYHWYHDCGKWLCRIVDENGRQHFPDHAKRSYEQYLKCGGDAKVAELIRQDMVVHLLKADDIAEFSNNENDITLLLTALAEVHSNAQMFGGTQSDSFKIKLKHLERRGRQIIKTIYEKN